MAWGRYESSDINRGTRTCGEKGGEKIEIESGRSYGKREVGREGSYTLCMNRFSFCCGFPWFLLLSRNVYGLSMLKTILHTVGWQTNLDRSWYTSTLYSCALFVCSCCCYHSCCYCRMEHRQRRKGVKLSHMPAVLFLVPEKWQCVYSFWIWLRNRIL